MKRRKHDPKMFESIQARVAKGESVSVVCKENKITPAHFYSWRQRQKAKKKAPATIEAAGNKVVHALDATRYAEVSRVINNAINNATQEPRENNNNEPRGFLLVGSPKFLAEVMNQL